MSKLAETILLGPTEEAERLWKGAQQLRGRVDEDLIALCEFLDLGLRAAEILVVQHLQGVKDKFPATIALLLDTPDPEIDANRDAITTPKVLQFTDVIDLLSVEELDCVSPVLHRGWEDRRFSCRRSRKTAQGVLQVSLDEPDRDRLLLLSAYRNRIFRFPPPVKIQPASILEAFDTLSNLVERLAGR